MIDSHYLKRFTQKIGIKILRKLDIDSHSEVHSRFEVESFSICKTFISDPDSVLIMSPISGKRYIESKKKQVYVTIEPNKLTVTNHKYSYDVDIFGKAYTRIQRLFDTELNNRCNKYEADIYANIKHSLTDIYKNLNNESI